MPFSIINILFFTLKGKNKENKGVFVFGSSFSGLSFRVFVFEDEQRGKNKENKGVLGFGSSFSGLRS